jgi:hypothetical protein
MDRKIPGVADDLGKKRFLTSRNPLKNRIRGSCTMDPLVGLLSGVGQLLAPFASFSMNIGLDSPELWNLAFQETGFIDVGQV